MQINKYIDHTILKPEATEEDVARICEEALKYNVASVCVNSCYTSFVREKLKGSHIKVCVTIGFPLGACSIAAKVFEAKDAIENGAQEIDMVINVGMLKSKRYDLLENDIRSVYEECKGRALLKVILENCLLSKDEITEVCKICKKIGVDFVKTSTGFNKGGATAEDVKLMKSIVGPDIKVKAAGGIRDYATALAMLEAGADRLGLSSTVNILEEAAKL